MEFIWMSYHIAETTNITFEITHGIIKAIAKPGKKSFMHLHFTFYKYEEHIGDKFRKFTF